jgi:hypothetical protein
LRWTGEAERILCIMPVSYSYGVAMGLFLAPNWHGTLVPLEKFVAEDGARDGRERAHHHLSRQPDRFRRPAQWARIETRYRT